MILPRLHVLLAGRITRYQQQAIIHLHTGTRILGVYAATLALTAAAVE
jgi:hypothetical protein